MNTDSLARKLAFLRPDRGNRYASRTIKTKGAAAYAQWQETVRVLVQWIEDNANVFDRDAFIAIVHGEQAQPSERTA